MTFEQILTILLDPIASDLSKTPFQRAADLHAKLQTAPQDSQKPVQARRGRRPSTNKVETEIPPAALENGFDQTGTSDASA